MYTKNLVSKYDQIPAGGNPRQAEAWALTKAATNILDAIRSEDKEALRNAVRMNWRLWTIIQSELLDPQCQLPQEIRSNMISLAAFVDKTTVGLLSDLTNKSSIDSLVNINKELAAGLRESLDNDAGDVTTQPPVVDGSKSTDMSA